MLVSLAFVILTCSPLPHSICVPRTSPGSLMLACSHILLCTACSFVLLLSSICLFTHCWAFCLFCRTYPFTAEELVTSFLTAWDLLSLPVLALMLIKHTLGLLILKLSLVRSVIPTSHSPHNSFCTFSSFSNKKHEQIQIWACTGVTSVIKQLKTASWPAIVCIKMWKQGSCFHRLISTGDLKRKKNAPWGSSCGKIKQQESAAFYGYKITNLGSWRSRTIW